jgi:hypothetical protein
MLAWPVFCLQVAAWPQDPATLHPADAVWYIAVPDVQALAPQIGQSAIGAEFLQRLFQQAAGSGSKLLDFRALGRAQTWTDWQTLLAALGRAGADVPELRTWLAGLESFSVSVSLAPETREAFARYLELGWLPAGGGDPRLYRLDLVGEFNAAPAAELAAQALQEAWLSWGGTLAADDLAALQATASSKAAVPKRPATRKGRPSSPFLELAPEFQVSDRRLTIGLGGPRWTERSLAEAETLRALRAAYADEVRDTGHGFGFEMLRQVGTMVPREFASDRLPTGAEDRLLDTYTRGWSAGQVWRSLSVALSAPPGWQTIDAARAAGWHWPPETGVRIVAALPLDPREFHWGSLWPASRGFDLQRLLQLGNRGLSAQFFASIEGPLVASQRPRPEKDGSFAVAELTLAAGADTVALEAGLAQAFDRLAEGVPAGQALHLERGDATVHGIRSPAGPRFALCLREGRLVLGAPPGAVLEYVGSGAAARTPVNIAQGLFLSLELDWLGLIEHIAQGPAAQGILAVGSGNELNWLRLAGQGIPAQRERYSLSPKGRFLTERLGPLPFSRLRQVFLWGE